MGEHLAAQGVVPSFWTASGRLHGAKRHGGSPLDVLDTDLIHNFGVWRPFNAWVSGVARVSRTPLVICPMGMLEPWSLNQKSLRKRLALSVYQRAALDGARALHASAEPEATNLRALGLKPPVALIPHGVEVPATLPDRTASDAATRTALFLSRIHPKKGLMDLVNVWARLRPDGWQLVIAGPDPVQYRAEVQAAVRDLKLEQVVSFAGHVSDAQKRALLESADLFVLPTYSENFGAVVPEALAYGVPVVTTTGAPWAQLLETRSGFWVEPGEEGLTGALQQACALDSHALRAMGRRGRDMVVGQYSWEAIIGKQIELYRWLVYGDSKPTFIRD
jgi:glycosyltransferase involved in cell wall biosynthesis